MESQGDANGFANRMPPPALSEGIRRHYRRKTGRSMLIAGAARPPFFGRHEGLTLRFFGI
jgi:hypothetical protein